MKKTILIYSVMMLVFALSAYGLIYSLDSISPQDDFYTNNQTPEFSFEIFGDTSTNNCTLYIDDLPYGTNESIVNGTAVIIADANISEGPHTWYVNCTDIDGTNTTGTRTINIDTQPPNLTRTVSHSQISRANNSQEFVIELFWSEEMNQSVGPTLYFSPSISAILNSCGYYWIDSNNSIYNCTIYNILPYEQFDVNMTIFNASDLAGNVIDPLSYEDIIDIDMTAPQPTNYNITPGFLNDSIGFFIGFSFNFIAGFNYTGIGINTTSCSYSINGNSGPWYNNETAFNGTHCVFNQINSSGFNNSAHTLSARIFDLWNNNITWSITSVFLDISAPTTTPSGNGYTFGDWTNNPVNVTFSCSDGANSSGCQATYTCWDTDNSCTPINLTSNDASIFISEEGTFYVRYFSVDNLNNTETVKNVTVKIDSSNLTIAISDSSNQLLGSNSLPYIISGTATGGSSSIDTLTLFINGLGNNISNVIGNNWNYTWNPSEGTYVLIAEVCNLAATCTNSSTISNITFDFTAPNTTDNADKVNWSRIFVITLSPTDTNGVAYTSYRISALPWQNGTIIRINSSTNVNSGNIIISYYSVDTLGNKEDENNITVQYDVTAPTSVITGFKDDYSPFTFNEWSTDTALVNFSGTDASHSGYNRTLFCIESATCSPSNIWNGTLLNISTPGITYIRYRSVDNVNNTESIQINRVMILQNNTVYINESLSATENVTNIIVPENNVNSNIYVPPNVDATLDFSESINISINTTHNVTLDGSINATVNTTIIISLEMPGNLTLSGNDSWLGNFNLPKLMPLDSVTITVTGYTVTKDIVVEIGADDVPIVLDKAVRIKLTGKSNKLLWYGSGAITTTCVNDTQEWADANLSSDITGHCRITPTNTTDLIIWTKHLSTFTTYTQTVTRTDGGGGGGGGGGSSGGSYVPPSANATIASPSVTYSYVLLERGTKIINVTHSQIPLYAMALTTNANVSNARLKIILIANPPMAQTETVYKYFQIDHETITDSIITGAKLQFKVSKSWLTENKVEKNQVVLYRYVNGWNMLQTIILKEDSESIYYESTSPGLSIFAIATKPKPPVTVVEPSIDDTVVVSPEEEVFEGEIKKESSNPTVVIIIVLTLIIASLYLFYASKYKNNKTETDDKNTTKEKDNTKK